MRILRFEREGNARYGILENETVKEVVPSSLLSLETGLHERFSEAAFTGESFPLSSLKLLPPCLPSKIVAVGLNYRSHAQELSMPIPEDPLIFIKPSTAVIGPNGYIDYPPMSRRIDYEAELGVVMGKVAKNVGEIDARRYIIGYTCFNDVTARDLQGKDKQFTRSKGFDTFAPLGPWIETELDPENCRVESYLSGELRQSGNTADLIFPVYKLVSFISSVMTLLPGDLIATGTPSGIGPMLPGDTVEIKVEGIGTLKNTVSSP